jgi:hypothetical protein
MCRGRRFDQPGQAPREARQGESPNTVPLDEMFEEGSPARFDRANRFGVVTVPVLVAMMMRLRASLRGGGGAGREAPMDVPRSLPAVLDEVVQDRAEANGAARRQA